MGTIEDQSQIDCGMKKLTASYHGKLKGNNSKTGPVRADRGLSSK